MEFKQRRLSYLISAMLLLVCFYQMYWLTVQYKEIKNILRREINEVLRSADFEELVHRVDEINRMKFQGKVDINMGYDHGQKETIVKTDVKKEASPSPRETPGTQTVVSPQTFRSILKTPADLIKMGLNMQRGIHLSLDGIKDVDLTYLDRVITEKLDSLGVGEVHTLLYIRPGEHSDRPSVDTIANIGSPKAGSNNTFTLELPDNAEYQMIIPQWHLVVLRKMLPSIVFSAITLILLVATFVYLIRIMRRSKELEEIKTDFTNNITHELKTPIAVAYAANDALLNFYSDDNTPRMQRYLNVCQDQLRLLDRLIEQILSLSMERKNSFILNQENVDLRSLINELCENYKMKYSESVSFRIECQADLIIESDRMHLSNIIGNIIDNAIKYSKGVAQVTVKTWLDKSGYVNIEITDRGIGMTSEQMKHIFEKFYRVPHGNLHDVKGYGLGLFYVRSMTEKLGGAVKVTSIPNKGSCFILKFPKKNYE